MSTLASTTRSPAPRRRLSRACRERFGLYVCGPTVYDFIHIGNARTFTTFDMVCALAARLGLRGDVRAQHHRHRRQDHRARAREAASPSRRSRERMVARVPRGRAIAWDCCVPTRSRALRATCERDARPDRDAREEGPRLSRRPTATCIYSVRELPGLRAGSRGATSMSCARASASRSKRRRTIRSTSRSGRRPSRASRAGLPFSVRVDRGGTSSARRWRAASWARTVDIHGGGWDLQFPHHENEIAQSEGASGAPFARAGCTARSSTWTARRCRSRSATSRRRATCWPSSTRCRAREQRATSCCAATTAARSTSRGKRSRTRATRCAASTRRLREVAPAPLAAIDWNNPYAARFRDAMNDDFDTPIAFAVLHELRARSEPLEVAGARRGLLKALGGTDRVAPVRSRAIPPGRDDGRRGRARSPSAARRRRRRTMRAPTRSASSSRPMGVVHRGQARRRDHLAQEVARPLRPEAPRSRRTPPAPSRRRRARSPCGCARGAASASSSVAAITTSMGWSESSKKCAEWIRPCLPKPSLPAMAVAPRSPISLARLSSHSATVLPAMAVALHGQETQLVALHAGLLSSTRTNAMTPAPAASCRATPPRARRWRTIRRPGPRAAAGSPLRPRTSRRS